ncbi:MAG: 3-oxoacyl-ACP reductase FabG [Bacteroidota bacterium]|nr:3-oxoacyl-ACP reductase FabG [Bacteroidota bacterium]MDP4233230.1 3-oxoacyl-ACP reductase FabG [Bacteroidota bacterium]MDP4242151.1 3-oxoacyl-ACP reductase FabG [Bacteroidota bacterium]MDP4287800.1 3-oxoacyl-ACP reductase FabG [Bacteroidota bacterium]
MADHARIAIVTGGAQGIGEAIAQRLASQGCFVIIVDLAAELGDAAVEGIGRDRTTFHRCDISDADDVRQLFEWVRATYGHIDVLVNNAGVIRDHMIWKMTPEEFDLVIRVNLRGTWLMCRQAAMVMKERKTGAIINISSRAWLGNLGQTNYSASKAGIVGLTRSLALELGPHMVRVNAVAPGLIDTPLARALPPEVQQKLINAQPTRSMGQPEDVAEVVAFLASDECRFMTGQVLYVDGGKSIGAGI